MQQAVYVVEDVFLCGLGTVQFPALLKDEVSDGVFALIFAVTGVKAVYERWRVG